MEMEDSEEGTNSHHTRKSSKHRHQPVDLQHPLSVELSPNSLQPEAPRHTKQPEAPHHTQQPEAPHHTQQPEASHYTQQPETTHHTQQPEAPSYTQPRDRSHQLQQRDGSRLPRHPGQTQQLQSGVYQPESYPAHPGVHRDGQSNRRYDPRYESQPVLYIISQPSSQPERTQQLQSGIHQTEFYPVHPGVHGETNRGYDPRYESQPVQYITSQPTSVTYPQQVHQGAERPRDYTWLATYVCLCWCCPVGLLAMISARQALWEFKFGKVAVAKSASKTALELSILGIIIGVIVLVIVIAVVVTI